MNKNILKKISGILLFFGLVLLIIGAIQESKTLHLDINIVLLSGAICFSIGAMTRIIIDLRKDESAKFVRNLFIYFFAILGFFLLITGIIIKKLYFIPLCSLSLGTGGLIRSLTNMEEKKHNT